MSHECVISIFRDYSSRETDVITMPY